MLREATQVGRLAVNLGSQPPEPVVSHEQIWFEPPRDSNGQGRVPTVSASRWTGFASAAREEVSSIEPECHVLGIALRPMDLTVFAAQKLIHTGRMQPGTMRLAEPELQLRAIFLGAFDVLHMRIPNAVMDECIAAACGQSPSGQSPSGLMRSSCSQPFVDPVIERLAHALLRADDFGGTFGRCYADGVGLAIVARLLARNVEGGSAAGGSRTSGLPKWRLKRATDYIAAHLGEPIGLTEIAASTGLTRMHFAAQFRAATGLRPHEYLVRRRIERAQELLAASDLPLVEIALEVGFKAQAHFTTVFTKVVGEPPNAWRRQTKMDTRLGLVTERG